MRAAVPSCGTCFSVKIKHLNLGSYEYFPVRGGEGFYFIPSCDGILGPGGGLDDIGGLLKVETGH